MLKLKRYGQLGICTFLFSLFFMLAFSLNSAAASPTSNDKSIQLLTLTVDATTLTAPGKLTMKAEFSSPMEQIDVVSFQFVGNTTKNKLYAMLLPEKSNDIVLEIDTFATADTYSLSQVTLTDKSGNTYYYKKDPIDSEKNTYTQLTTDLIFTVENDSETDLLPPEISEVTADKKEVLATEAITLTPTIKEEGSGLDYATFCFENESTGKRLYITATPEEPNPACRISTYQIPGIYKLVEISAADLAGNRVFYVSTYKTTDPSFFKKLPLSLEFTVKNEFFNTFSENGESANLSKDIDLLPQGGRILIDCTKKDEIPASVFRTAQGLDKTLYFYKDAEIWSINGQSITEPSIFTISTQKSFDDTKEQTDKNLLITFPSANKFPGSFQFFLNLSGEESFSTLEDGDFLLLYRYDEENGKNAEGEPLSFDSDGYISFTITYPSDLLIKKELAPKPTQTSTNTSPPTGPMDEIPVIVLLFSLSCTLSLFLLSEKHRNKIQ